MQTILQVENIQKYYKAKTNITKAVDNISFELAQGDYVGIMGASGSGKSTLLNCIATIDTVTAGHIYMNGVDITQLKEEQLSTFRREQLGFVFQDFNLLDTLNAHDNIALALAIAGENPDVIEEKVEQVARLLGISEILEKYPYEISGGQKQRIACARAVITTPSLVLADEPTGNLDGDTEENIMNILLNLAHNDGKCVIVVTHSKQVAKYADELWGLNQGNLVFVK